MKTIKDIAFIQDFVYSFGTQVVSGRKHETSREDGWGEGLVPTAANVARNELLGGCFGLLECMVY